VTKLLDLIAKRVQLRAGMTKTLDQVFSENRSITAREEIEFDSMSAQLTELDSELENRGIMARMLNEHITHLLKQNGNAQ
jgi:hypothetical protein